MKKKIVEKIYWQHQEAHVIDFYINRESSGTIDENEDKKYVQSCLEDGIELVQAVEQLEVMRDQYDQSLLEKVLISKNDLIQSEIDAITGGDEHEWRLEGYPSISEIQHVEQLKRMMED